MIQAHVFNNEQDAVAALQTINVGEGFPAGNDALTTGYTMYYPCHEGCYIKADEVTQRYLGPSMPFEEPQPPRDEEII